MKKRMLIPALLLIGVVMFCGCADTKENNKAETTKKDMFYMYSQDGKDVYAFDGRSEKNKIGSDIMSICYEDSINSFITLNNNNDLCKIDSSNNKEKLCSDACFDYKITEEGGIYFINKDSDLYVKKKDAQDKEKVSSNVASYEIDGDSIVYVDNDNNLFIKNKDADKNKICSDVNSYKMSSDNNYAAYSSDNELYLKDIAKDEKEKICDDFQSESFTFADSDSIVYLDEYNAEKQKGELYYKKYGSEKKKLADDVTYIMADVDGAYYINEDTPESIYNQELSGFEKEPEYKQLLKDSFVISWVENGVINYECCVVGTGSMNTFILKYPASQKADYESVTERIYSSFKSPGVSEAH